jgi:hypothetical protein
MADRRFALLVANSSYTDPTLTRLQAPAHDAEGLGKVLRDPAVGGFDVEAIFDAPAGEVSQRIEAFFDGRQRDDLLLLYFSGHGILDEGARLYFATADTRVDRPRSTAVSAHFVNDVMSESRSRRQVLVLDCCNSGAFGRGVKAGGKLGTRERFEGRGKVVITASDVLQYAFEADRVEGEPARSVFTEAIVEGLRTGDADHDGDGEVTLDELYDYVYGRVLDAAPRQRPGKWAFGVEGQIVVARAQPREATARPPLPSPPSRAAPTLPRGRLGLAAALAVAAAVALGAVLVLRDGGDGGAPTGSLGAGREATLAVVDAWREGRLGTVDDRSISTSARQTLAAFPTEPVQPVSPAVSDCHGEPDDVACPFSYPAEGIHLLFHALRYPQGYRITGIECFDSETGDVPEGGVAGCAEIVRGS